MSTQSNRNVLAVLVLYQRTIADAAPSQTLLNLLDRENGLRLHHWLIYDNSPQRCTAEDQSAANITIVWSPDNVGTAGAYRNAAGLAAKFACDWILLLDQDTQLPSDYLQRAASVLEKQDGVSALVPRVWQGRDLLSPAMVSATGMTRPVRLLQSGTGVPTAISSGVIIRRDALAEAAIFPSQVWLDYVDHWMFLKLAENGRKIGEIDADLTHDLSVQSLATLSRNRLVSMLAAEATFHAELGAARIWLLLRRIARAARYAATGHFSHAATIVRATIGGVGQP